MTIKTEIKKKIYGVRQIFLGADQPTNIYFTSKEERDKYYNQNNHIDKLRTRTQNPNIIYYNLYDTAEQAMEGFKP